VYVYGAQFGTRAADLVYIEIAGARCAGVEWVNSTTLVCYNLPAGGLVTGPAVVKIGKFPPIAGGWFVVLPTPAIFDITPTSDNPDTLMIIRGENLKGDPYSVITGVGLVQFSSKTGLGNTTACANYTVAVPGKLIFCVVPDAPVTSAYMAFVQLSDGPMVTSPQVFTFRRIVTLVPTWLTADYTVTALPSAGSTVFNLAPPIRVDVVDDVQLVPEAAVYCILKIGASFTTQLGRDSLVRVMMGGTTQVQGFSPAGRPNMTATFGDVHIIAEAGTEHHLEVACSINGAGPWFSPPSRLRVRLQPLSVSWLTGPALGTLPTASGGALSAARVTPISPPLQLRFFTV
jgi:hypothetical protein